MKPALTRILSAILLMQSLFFPAQAAQLSLQAPDIEPPVVVFDVTDTTVVEGIRTFSVSVTDNVGVANVTLYVKGNNDVVYRPKVMKRSPDNPNLYTVDLTLDPVISKTLQVYIRADDVSGNSVFEGQEFSPLTFTVVPVSSDSVTAGQKAAGAEEEEGMNVWTMVLIGLGALALAGGSGGGGGGSTGGSGSIDITTEIPTD